jgi:hypothetical protein
MRAFRLPPSGKRLPLLLLGAAAALLCGCGKEPGMKLFAVQGKVLVEGKPVKKGTVSFRPDASRGNKSMEQPTGVLREDGGFELSTQDRPGAPPGWYRVLVIADNFQVVDPPPSPVWPNFPEGFLPKPLVHDRYLYFNQTDLIVEVVEDPPEDAYVLKLKP